MNAVFTSMVLGRVRKQLKPNEFVQIFKGQRGASTFWDFVYRDYRLGEDSHKIAKLVYSPGNIVWVDSPVFFEDPPRFSMHDEDAIDDLISQFIYVLNDIELFTCHRASSKPTIIKSSFKVGCYHCRSVFLSEAVTIRTSIRQNGQTDLAICPGCKVDTLVGDANTPLATNHDWLNKMHRVWFGGY